MTAARSVVSVKSVVLYLSNFFRLPTRNAEKILRYGITDFTYHTDQAATTACSDHSPPSLSVAASRERPLPVADRTGLFAPIGQL
jgi:hypothetical protein